MFEECDSLNRQYEWLFLPERFIAKVGLVFVLTLKNAFS